MAGMVVTTAVLVKATAAHDGGTQVTGGGAAIFKKTC